MALLQKKDKIYVAGHRGLVGSAIVECLRSKGYSNLILKTRQELNLLDQKAVKSFYKNEKPEVVIVAAAKVGGIGANHQFRADFILENLEIQNNVIGLAHEFEVHRLIFLGSSCIYPRDAKQPIQESAILSGPLEITNRPYALAKIAGLELIESLRKQFKRDYFSVMPTNLYGPRDNFDPETSHALPGLLRRFYEAKSRKMPSVKVWGSGKPYREWMYAPDCAEAIVFLAEKLSKEMLDDSPIGKVGWSHINIGSGDEVTIADLAKMISDVVGYTGKIEFDSSKPDGTPRKLVDSSFLHRLGWSRKFGLKEGISLTLQWFRDQISDTSQSTIKQSK